VRTLLRPGGPFGPLLEGFVLMELARQLTWLRNRAELFHYRTKDKVEVDAVLENRQGRVVEVEVKASSTVAAGDVRGLRTWPDESAATSSPASSSTPVPRPFPSARACARCPSVPCGRPEPLAAREAGHRRTVMAIRNWTANMLDRSLRSPACADGTHDDCPHMCGWGGGLNPRRLRLESGMVLCKCECHSSCPVTGTWTAALAAAGPGLLA
jgi:Domain of unknown function (DUF4143)